MYSSVFSADISGMEARIIRIEADVSEGLPVFDMVGYLASAVKEARERVRIAIRNIGIRFPAKRITVNLSPADLRKEGTTFDLSISISLLNAFGYLPDDMVADTLFVGELGLDGTVRGSRGVLAMIQEGKKSGIRRFVVPQINSYEGGMIEGVEVYGVSSLTETLDFLRGDVHIEPVHLSYETYCKKKKYEVDFSDISGCRDLKRAAEIAVSGRHNLLMIGAPGTGKTMLARRLGTILPDMDVEESLNVTRMYSISGLLTEDMPIVTQRPFRAPHHTVTAQALTGGGRIPSPGEISLATGGVLFLDELPEFDTKTLEVLREPLEERRVTVARVGRSYEYPADCMFVAAMNPCKCGFYPNREKCRCTISEIHRYLSKISQPLLDRMDLCVESGNDFSNSHVESGVEPQIIRETKEETSARIRMRVERTVKIQKKRYRGEGILYNSELSGRMLSKYCALGKREQEYFEEIIHTQEYSRRGISRLLKVARTIADMEESERILEHHITEAVCYRSIDKEFWG